MPDLSVYRIWARLPSYRQRVAEAREILRRASTLGPMVIATSWGKDSVALADLALETIGRVPLLHLEGASLPGNEPIADHFRARTEVHTVAPPMTLADFIAWLRETGLPHERTKSEQGRAVQAMKKDPGVEWCLEHGYAVQALGMRGEESKGRRACFRVRGATYRRAGLWITNPLAWWRVQDTWAYIAERGLPYHRLYDCETHGLTRETNRNTGWLATDGAHDGRIAWLRKHFPDQYRALAREFPQVSILS